MLLSVTLNPSLDDWVWLRRLSRDGLTRALRCARYPGGKGINVSRVAMQLRYPTLAVALAGGEDGHILSHALSQSGVPHRFVTVSGATRHNYQIQTELPRRLMQINCPGPLASGASISRISRLVGSLLRRAKCLVCSGSLPPGAPAKAYASLIMQARRRGVLSVLDTSGDALRAGLRARPWLIKPNLQEAEQLLGRRLTRMSLAINAARSLAADKAECVLLSLGADGAILAMRGARHAWWARAPAVRADSAVGSGDSLVSGFVVGWLRTRSVTSALRLGVACGAATAITPGTELCHRRDIRRLSSGVRIESV